MHENIFDSTITLETMKQHLLEYIVGSMVFAVIMAILLGILSYIILRLTLKQYNNKAV